jgi:hypothetical protein
MKTESTAVEFKTFLAQRARDRTRLIAEQGASAVLAF